jgi:hypothetical protein
MTSLYMVVMWMCAWTKEAKTARSASVEIINIVSDDLDVQSGQISLNHVVLRVQFEF